MLVFDEKGKPGHQEPSRLASFGVHRTWYSQTSLIHADTEGTTESVRINARGVRIKRVMLLQPKNPFTRTKYQRNKRGHKHRQVRLL